MAEININMNRYNGSTYDTLYPATTISQVANGQQQIKVVNITLGTNWTAGDGYYTQAVTISGGTANTKVDLQAGYDVIAQMLEDGCMAIYVQNDSGVFTAYAVGEAPSAAITVQGMCSEVTV